MTLSRRMARLMVWLVALATVAGGAAASAQATQRAPAQASQRTATQASHPMPTFPDLSGVWCAGPSKCLAVGSAEVSDTQTIPISMRWNGQDWSYLKTPAKGQFFYALACTSWTHCMAVGSPGVAEEWNGTSWRALRIPSSANLDSIACPAARTCVAVGFSINSGRDTAFVWNGRSWRATAVPWPAGVKGANLASVACPSVTYCVAVGNHEVNIAFGRPIAFTWNGTRWRRAPMPPKEAFVIACPRPFLCIGVSSFQSVMWNRRSWRLVNMPLMNTPESIACPGRSFCMVDDPQFTEVWNGSSWSRIKPALNDTSALWCGSPTDCMAVGGDTNSRAGNASQWNGHSWRKLRVTTVDALDMISCASTTDCVAAGTANPLGAANPLAEEWNGTAWTVIAAPTVTSDDGNPPALSCPTASFCMAAGNSAAEEPQAQWWDGSTWHATSVPAVPDRPFLSSVSCTSQDNCVIVSGLDVAMVWNGSTWQPTSAAIAGQSVVLTSVSCSGAICMASGSATSSTCFSDCQTSFVAEEWNGSAWTVSDDVAFGINLFPDSRISCPTSTFCMEAGFNFSAMTWNGTSWQSVPSSNLFVDSLSCASAASCLTVNISASSGPDTTTTAWNGTSWQAAKSPPFGDALNSVSCPGAGACIAVGTDNNARAVAQSWNGTSWTPQAPVNP
jgi:hypothetical protein